MTHDELIEATAKALRDEDAKFHVTLVDHEEYYSTARAAIRVIAPAVLEEAIAQCEWPEEAELNNEFARGMATACCLNRDAIRALKTRYEQ